MGIISRGVPEWASPRVLVRRRDGTVRYCIDLRKVNEVTVKDRYPLPKISECIDASAFVNKYGKFVFNPMPFCLSNAPGLVLRGLSGESVVYFWMIY